MVFEEVSSILSDTKDSYSSNPYELFQVVVLVVLTQDLNAKFSRLLLKTHVICWEK